MGSAANWSDFGTLLNAGARGVRDVDPTIKLVLHIDQCGDKPTDTPGSALNTSVDFVDSALGQGVDFDILGESCYQTYQGDPNSDVNTKAGWANTLGGLAAKFPNLPLLAAEYGSLEREINDVVFGLAGGQGAGTFDWEPSEQGDWNTGHELLVNSGNTNTYVATIDLALFDAMKTAYASRL
jgi:arabinogalactan endo-1,4-beta-galactosidase